jgi:hypothetical protein
MMDSVKVFSDFLSHFPKVDSSDDLSSRAKSSVFNDLNSSVMSLFNKMLIDCSPDIVVSSCSIGGGLQDYFDDLWSGVNELSADDMQIDLDSSRGWISAEMKMDESNHFRLTYLVFSPPGKPEMICVQALVSFSLGFCGCGAGMSRYPLVLWDWMNLWNLKGVIYDWVVKSGCRALRWVLKRYEGLGPSIAVFEWLKSY